MLVLSRKSGESVEFPSLGIVVRVIGLRKSRIELGIDAPSNVKIARGENVSLGEVSGVINGHSDRSTLSPDFAYVEARIAALAELSDPKRRAVANRVAAEAIERLGTIRKTLSGTGDRAPGATSLADFVNIRAEVLEELAYRPDQSGSANVVRQPETGYAVIATNATVDDMAVSA